MKHIARKRFGQNFLVDRGVIAAIVRAIAPQPGEHLVEIGPGLAALTVPLMNALGDTPLHVVELDRDLVKRLRGTYAPTRLIVHEADALDFDFGQLPVPLRVAGNLPYNISSPLLFHLLTYAGGIRDQHFMLQKEVVERMVATPGDGDFGRLSVMLQLRYDMEMLFEVGPESFDPPPKVTSAIVRMIPKVAPQDLDTTLFAALVAQAFSQRRKMLRNTLREHIEDLEAVGIAPTARAEEVSVETFVALTRRVMGRGRGG